MSTETDLIYEIRTLSAVIIWNRIQQTKNQGIHFPSSVSELYQELKNAVKS